MFLSDGTVGARRLQAVARHRQHCRRDMDHRRGGMLYHRCRVLLHQQTEIYAQRLPFLRTRRLSMSHHSSVGHTGKLPIKEHPLDDILREVGEAHVAFPQIGVVEGEGGTHVLWLMTHRCDMLQIVA